MIVIASTNGQVGIADATEILRRGGTALDAVEAGIRPVEENPLDNTVGYNGFPNILGNSQLDASIMNGRTLESGAVAALAHTMYAVSVARKVMEMLPHVLLVGAGADRFAREMGFSATGEMMDDVVRGRWERRLREEMPAETFNKIHDQDNLWQWVKLATDPERAWSTVNFIAQDSRGDIAAGVSTSGWAWKYPGRVGDSPIIGAGIYADNRYGAATCTGMGEMAIRACTAHSLVFYMKMGQSVQTAATQAMRDLNDLGGRFISRMNLIALDKEGNHIGCTSVKGYTYIYQTTDMSEHVEIERTYVEIVERWDRIIENE